jgi:uncharacterized protein YjdB
MKNYPRNTLMIVVATISLVPLSGCFCGQFFRGPDDVIGTSIAPGSTSIQAGRTQQYTAKGTFGDGSISDVTNQTTWDSSDSSIAEIDGTGQATGKTPGTVTITGTCQCYPSTAVLIVNSQAASLVSISLTPLNGPVQTGHSQQFTAIGNYSDGSTVVITPAVTWAASDSSVVEVSSKGLATGVTGGNATITAVSGEITARITVSVEDDGFHF